MVLSLGVLYDILLRLLGASIGTDTGVLHELSELKLFRLSMRRREYLLKRRYFSGCLAAALANILRKIPSDLYQ